MMDYKKARIRLLAVWVVGMLPLLYVMFDLKGPLYANWLAPHVGTALTTIFMSFFSNSGLEGKMVPKQQYHVALIMSAVYLLMVIGTSFKSVIDIDLPNGVTLSSNLAGYAPALSFCLGLTMIAVGAFFSPSSSDNDG